MSDRDHPMPARDGDDEKVGAGDSDSGKPEPLEPAGGIERLAPVKIGPYRLEDRLGKGGMGEVYRGYDERLGRPIALKRILASNAGSARIRERFRREARMVAQLNHPSIVQVFDWVEQEGEDWLVMELIDGAPLNEVVIDGELSIQQRVACALGIAEGLESAHRAGIIHRDLKLSNVMLTEDGVKILDFGIAKSQSPMGEEQMATLTQEGAVMGSLSAMSPEQALGQEVDHRSDLFSLGSLLYELLTGTPPFKGRNTSETLIRIYSWEHLPIEERNPDIPYRLCRLIDRLLEKEPANRPVSASEVVNELEETVAELGGRSSRIFKARPDLELPGSGANPVTGEMAETLAEGVAVRHSQTRAAEMGSSESGLTGTRPRYPDSGGRPSVGSGQAEALRSGRAPRVPRRWPYVAIGLVALLAAVFFFSSRGDGPLPEGETRSGISSKSRAADGVDAGNGIRPQRIAVLPFENFTGQDEFASYGLIIADWLTQGLSRSGGLEIVPTDLAARSVRFATRNNDGGSFVDLRLVADDTRAGTVISGAYYRSGDELILRGQITNVIEDRVISPLGPLRTPAADPIHSLGTLEEATRAKVAAAFDQQLAPLGQLANSPPTYEAYQAYVQGMEEFWQLDFPAAVERFERAAEIAPSFAMPQLMAATAHVNMGRFDAVEPIVRAVDVQRENLAMVDRFFLDWLKAESRGDYASAAEIAAKAAAQAPLSGWPQTLGVDSLRANQPRRALAALAPLDAERGYLRGWVPHFEYLTLAHHLIEDHEGELESARRGRKMYPDSLIVLTAEARALVALGRVEEALALLQETAGLRHEFLHTVGLARSLIAFELAAHGHEGLAAQAAELALDWYRAQNAPIAVAEREGEALILLFLGRHEEALAAYRSLVEDLPERVDLLGYLGAAAQALDRQEEADEIMGRLEGIDRPFLFGQDAFARAVIHAWRGDKSRATELFRDAVSDGYVLTWPRLYPHTDPIWRPLREEPDFLEAIEPRG